MSCPTLKVLALFMLLFGSCAILHSESSPCKIDWSSFNQIFDSKSAVEQLDSIKKSCQLNDFQLLKWHHTRGKYCVVLSKYDEALDHFHHGLTLSKQAEPDTFQAIFCNQLGVVKYYLGLKTEAQDWFIKAEQIAEKNQMLRLQGFCLNNIGALYTEALQFDSAETHLLKALSVYENMGGDVSQSYLHTYRILATTYEMQGEADRAYAMYSKMLQIAQITNDLSSVAKALLYMSQNEAKNGEFDSALVHADQAMALALKDSSNIDAMLMARGSLAQVNALAGNYKVAYDAIKEASTLRQRTFSKDLESKVGEMEARFNTETERQQRILAEAKAETTEQRFKLVLASGLILLLLLIGSFIIYQQRQKRRRAEHNIKVQKGRIAAVLEGEKRERTRIARDLHDGVSQLLFALKLNLSALGVKDEKSIDILDQSIDEVRTLSHDLLPKQLGQGGLIEALNQLALQLSASGKLKTTFENKTDSLNLNSESKANIYRIVQEVVNNAIKHARASLLKIELFKENRSLIIRISDDGIGFQISQIDNAAGIGWKNIMARMELLNGTLSSTPSDKGTSLEFRFPII